MSERHITETGGFCVPNNQDFYHTPNTTGMDGGSNSRRALAKRQMWATPNTLDSLPPKSPEALHREATVVRPGRSKPSNLRDQVSNMKMWRTPTVGMLNADRAIDPDYAARKVANGQTITLADQVKNPRMWPTPCANSHTGAGSGPNKTGAPNLQTVVAMWPTATATAYKGWSPGHNRAATDDRLDYTVEREAYTAGQQTPPMRLSGTWVEWLMNFPIGFTVARGFKK